MDEDWGTFGFLHWDRFDRLPLEIITVIICNMFGTMGYIRSLRYFDPFVVSVAALSEPVVAQLLAALAQVGLLPGWRGWIGNVLIALGTYWVAYHPTAKNEEPKQEDGPPPEKKEEPQEYALEACDTPQ
jgi:drug/metabolite transporter (DMT)-like permease